MFFNIPTLLKDSLDKAKGAIVRRVRLCSRDPLKCIGLFSALLFFLAALLLNVASWQSSDKIAGAIISSDTALQKNFVESNNFQPESPELNLVRKNPIVEFSPPVPVPPRVLGAIWGEPESEANKEITEYEVVAGDSLSGIAERFGISLNTLLWANNLSKNSVIKVGQKLVISPVTGVIYHVKNGDTVSEIARIYKAKADDIVEFNELASRGDIFIGDILVVPGGVMPASSVPSASLAQIPIASSYFICPIASPCRVTQRLHYYNAIDFSHGKCGDSIYAAAGGVVKSVKYGWNGGAGNTIVILHPNGVATSYGHIQAATVTVGDNVYQGPQSAIMGGNRATQGAGAGRSTGCPAP